MRGSSREGEWLCVVIEKGHFREAEYTEGGTSAVPPCSIEYIVQCLIRQRLLPIDAHPSFAPN